MSKINKQKNDNVIVDFEQSDDAAVIDIGNDKLLVQTVDFFSPIVDDPHTFGQIAAANSLSDIYAMGAKPLFALNIVGFPTKELSNNILAEILKGGASLASKAGIPIVGGHSVDDSEIKYGLVVTGEVKKNDLIKNSNAKNGDLLLLTKPLGTGILYNALKKGLASSDDFHPAIESMIELNKEIGSLLKKFNVNRFRISVFKSLNNLSAQIIDDKSKKTLVSASSIEKEIKGKKAKKMDKSSLIGEILAKRAKEKNINEVYFDRGEYKYHGRVKTFAETLRKNGLKF